MGPGPGESHRRHRVPKEHVPPFLVPSRNQVADAGRIPSRLRTEDEASADKDNLAVACSNPHEGTASSTSSHRMATCGPARIVRHRKASQVSQWRARPPQRNLISPALACRRLISILGGDQTSVCIAHHATQGEYFNTYRTFVPSRMRASVLDRTSFEMSNVMSTSMLSEAVLSPSRSHSCSPPRRLP